MGNGKWGKLEKLAKPTVVNTANSDMVWLGLILREYD
jgi:hypothetical protein